ncbi:MAG: amidohydrolase [Oscillospiraceae bacterium]|nr:amidohydrolase [Oscillospiraceae bacterium]
MNADIVLLGGKIASLAAKNTFCEALAIRGGWITDMGTDEQIKLHIGEDTKVIDLGGKTVIPGLHDAHTHALSWVTTLNSCACGAPAVKTIDELKAAIKRTAEKLPKGAWIKGDGLDPVSLAAACGRELTCYDLDEVSPDNPVLLQDCYAHGAFANSLAMKIAGIDKNTPDPEGGVIDRFADQSPTGYFHELAGIHLVMKHIPGWTEQDVRDNIIKVQAILNSNGYTSYTESTLGPTGGDGKSDTAGRKGAIDIYKDLQREGRLTCRVAIGLHAAKNGFQSAELVKEQLERFDRDAFYDKQWLKADMCKLFCDGVHISHTAWMLNDYPDTPGDHGSSSFAGETEEEQVQALYDMVLEATALGYQVGIHTVGDRAIEESLNAFINAYEHYPERHELRHYLIHAEGLCTKEQIEKAARYRIMISAQPAMGAYLTEPTIGIIGERGKNAWSMGSLLKAGVTVASGTDAIYGEYPRWQDGVAFAVNRVCTPSGKVTGPDERISVEDALRTYTINAAYQEHRENITGTLEVGKAADLAVLSDDIFTIEKDKISAVKVLLTMAGGRVVYTELQ